MKATDAKKFIGKAVVFYMKHSPDRARYSTVKSTAGRNIEILYDWLWAPDVLSMDEDKSAKPLKEIDDGTL